MNATINELQFALAVERKRVLTLRAACESALADIDVDEGNFADAEETLREALAATEDT